MWWVPLTIIVGKFIYDELNKSQKPRRKAKPILQKNFERLKKELKNQDSIKIALVGQPGSGKSSLLKNMTKGEVRPIQIIGTHTDATNWSRKINCNLISIYKNYIFVDVPGYDTLNHPVKLFIWSFPFNCFNGFIFVLNSKIQSSDKKIYNLITKYGKPICIARSYLDGLENYDITISEDDIRKRLSAKSNVPIIFFSNKSKENVDLIFNTIISMVSKVSLEESRFPDRYTAALRRADELFL